MPGAKQCPWCAMSIPGKAYVCPYCKKAVRTRPVVWIILGGIVLIFLLLMIAPINSEHNNQDNQSTAKYKSRALVTSALKAPSTAEFCTEDIRKFDFGGADAFEVKGCVDAQNSFGAKLRKYYTVVFLVSDGEFKLVDIKME